MVEFGYSLLAEQEGPQQLVSDAKLAEDAGFDFVTLSDHYYPWIDEQGHSPYAWGVLGAISQATSRVQLASLVTCPIRRYHPAVVAQKAATISLLSGGRFTLGIGAGENLNEHVVGDWPPAPQRHEMLVEALEIIRPLLHGETVRFSGVHFEVPQARLYDPPADGLPIAVAVSGRATADIAGEYGDAMVATQPMPQLPQYFDEAGGQGKPRYGQLSICYGPDEKQCEKLAYEQFRWSGFGWRVKSELPDPAAFATASERVRPEDVASSITCGPDTDKHVAAIRAYIDAGFTHVCVAQIGREMQEPFLDWARRELLPALRDEGTGHA
jgi:G6PDH family F420-dependent oxidoreductase